MKKNHPTPRASQPATGLPGPAGGSRGEISLAGVLPGMHATLSAFSPSLPAEQKLQLQSYGLTPGARIGVLQHSPVTVVQIDHLELALEPALARSIFIKDPG